MISELHMPAEWEQHRSTWLAWPEENDNWHGSLLKEVRESFIRMILELSKGESVDLLVRDEAAAKTIRRVLKKTVSSKVRFHRVRTEDAWIRDYGPVFVRKLAAASLQLTAKRTNLPAASCQLPAQKNIAFIKWKFNAWGRKYRNILKDDGVVDRISALKELPRIDTSFVLEGGSIDVNGRGSLLTTEACLLNPNRNPGYSKKEVERVLSKMLGVSHVIWLKRGIEGDDTDGHVDDLARFVSPTTIVASVEKNPEDNNFDSLKENLTRLKKSKNESGRKLRIVELPIPEKVCSPAGKRLPASYANFYIANAVVLVPVFGQSRDKEAVRILKKIFPGRQIKPINCTAMVHGFGAIHCVTQQEPIC